MPPKISVVIPVYNGSRYLAQAVSSVLEQDYPAHEIIAVDDGSTDGTPEILRSFGDRLIVRRVENRGSAHARNVGLELATGDSVAFLDHDDIWFRNRLEKQAELIERNPQAGVFCANFIFRHDRFGSRRVRHYDALRHRSGLNFNRPLVLHPFALLVRENFLGTASALCIRKSVVELAGPFDPSYRVAQDFEFILRCALRAPFVLCSQVLLYKRTHSGNISGDKVRTYTSHRRILLDVLERHGEEIRRQSALGPFLEALALNDLDLGNYQFEAGRRGEAFRLYREALGIRPTPRVAARLAWTVFKKGVRVATADRISRRAFRGLASA